MKKLFFIIPLSISITAMGCANDSNKSVSEEIITQTTTPEQQTNSVNENVDVKIFSKLVSQDGGQILDVRTPAEWANGVIKGAIKMNFFDKDFKTQLDKLDKTKPVYVYCKSGGRSGQAAKQMEKMGFKTIYNLIGGITAWNAAGKEVSK